MTDDEAAIRRVVDDWLAATTAGDARTVLGLMTDDAVFMVPGQAPFGKADFAAAFETMRGVRVETAGETLELRVLGDWAFIRNRLEVTVTPPAGPPVERSGHALTLLHKEADGRWRLARDANLLVTRG